MPDDENNLTQQFFDAVEEENIEEVKRILETGKVDINVKDNSGSTALHRCVFNDNFKIMNYLVEQGADIFKKDDDGLVPAEYVKEDLEKESFKLFDYHQLLVGKNNDKLQSSLYVIVNQLIGFHDTPKEEMLKSTKLLLGDDYTFDWKHHKEETGDTLLHYACRFKNENAVRFLLEECEVDVNDTNDKGKIPIEPI